MTLAQTFARMFGCRRPDMPDEPRFSRPHHAVAMTQDERRHAYAAIDGLLRILDDRDIDASALRDQLKATQRKLASGLVQHGGETEGGNVDPGIGEVDRRRQ